MSTAKQNADSGISTPDKKRSEMNQWKKQLIFS